ncbi:helix-turn-helix domain-containing protein [Clostridium tagluense]|uniref:Crp/Fnr family transcriptional regulator n=1 Tax=Clostridium tagluense TaxID=360422 RepID=UPI001C0A9619|nr:helix-turn-helix domain-containing protein [Clostridium tagluense]MBU3129087.1 helix-turn-helix domain-containing protein [Clostridium tagluense]MCB2311307.1 helix-turn-helix domain-containing protein [Clostridium tagluense]MCB2316051.1 helix-turn-helix domain-containing protein [Clostridium tagluense]MCB2320883.1 helix-turn-helix domain-containing protein [Clostridium tagluense]MCB2325920.1 helix-turn-helix domain-containing protein [Clostridium tagluense]
MRRILDVKILNQYIIKHNIERIFDDEILKYVQLHFYEKEEHILESGENLEYYYLLVDGKIKIYYPFENGKSMFLKFYKDFNTIGDLELLKGIPILCNIDAVEDTYLIAIPAAILRGKYFNNIKLLNHLVDSLSEKLCGTINNSSYNFVYPLINRLSSYLVEHLTDKNYIILNSSYLEIAQFLGATYRHLNRTLKEMESKSIIKCDDKKIYILDIEQLKELSKNMYIKSL